MGLASFCDRHGVAASTRVAQTKAVRKYILRIKVKAGKLCCVPVRRVPFCRKYEAGGQARVPLGPYHGQALDLLYRINLCAMPSSAHTHKPHTHRQRRRLMMHVLSNLTCAYPAATSKRHIKAQHSCVLPTVQTGTLIIDHPFTQIACAGPCDWSDRAESRTQVLKGHPKNVTYGFPL